MSDTFPGVERRQSDLAGRLDSLQSEVGTLRQNFGRLCGQVEAINTTQNRIEGRLESMQQANATAHKAQDDRLTELAERLGYRDGERYAHGRLTDWWRQILTALASAGFTAGALHFWK